MTKREGYELAYRLVRLEMAGKIDKATARLLLDQLPLRVVVAAWESRGNMPTGITYKWLSFERWLAFNKRRRVVVLDWIARRHGSGGLAA